MKVIFKNNTTIKITLEEAKDIRDAIAKSSKFQCFVDGNTNVLRIINTEEIVYVGE